MAEALSQSQIDELLQRMRSGNVDEVPASEESKVKEYDFTSPKKFTKEQMRSLSTLYENYSRILSVYLTGILRDVIEVEVTQIEEQRYFEYNNALPDSTLVAMVGFESEGKEYDGSTLMIQLPTQLGYHIVDRLMGGSSPPLSPERDFTEIEAALIKMVLTNITKYMQEAWSNFFTLNTVLRSVETNGRLLQAYSQQDIVVIVSMEVKDESFSGFVNVCMPAENLEEIIDSFSAKYSHGSRNQDAEKEKHKKNLMLGYLNDSGLEVEAVLDTFQMNLSDVAALQPGDVIALNKKIDSDITVNIENTLWCTARLGEVDEKKALKIVDILVK